MGVLVQSTQSLTKPPLETNSKPSSPDTKLETLNVNHHPWPLNPENSHFPKTLNPKP